LKNLQNLAQNLKLLVSNIIIKKEGISLPFFAFTKKLCYNLVVKKKNKERIGDNGDMFKSLSNH
jgi:hypothetical protein